MGIRNVKKEQLNRLESKTLDAQFVHVIEEGMNCSPFEAHAILDVVKEVYLPFFDEASPMAPPGKVTLMVVAADEPAGKPLTECERVPVCLTVHRGREDDRLLQAEGPQAFRRTRIADLCQEALSQGGLLTREDLAYHVFFCSTRTISRDLAALRKQKSPPHLPLRSLIQDIGPVLTHRVEIVRLALEGKTTTEIRDRTHHSPEAISNYVSTFTRCAQLADRGIHASQIAFLLRRGRSLIDSYLELLAQCRGNQTMAFHLDQLLSLGSVPAKKNERS